MKVALINQWPKLRNVTPARAALVLVSLVSTMVAGAIVVATRFLRPIADDYCLAFVADQGVIGVLPIGSKRGLGASPKSR